MDDEFEPDQAVEPTEAGDAAEPDDKRTRKLQTENESLRRRLRTYEAADKYGKDIASIIPDSLPITEWDGWVEKVRTVFPVAAQAPAEATTVETPAPEGPTPEELKLAAVTTQGQGAAPATGIFTPEEAIRLYESNPGQYIQMREAGLIQLEKLNKE